MLDSAFPHQLAITGLTTFPELWRMETRLAIMHLLRTVSLELTIVKVKGRFSVFNPVKVFSSCGPL
jgi:hypothetical protein